MFETISINNKLLVILSTVTVLFKSFVCFGATYYVDATHGNDNNDGLSPKTAWKNIAKVNSLHFEPLDSILFKRGENWRDKLNASSSGTYQNHIIYGAFGDGNEPTINGSDIVTGWEFFTHNIYRAELVHKTPQAFLNGTLLKKGKDQNNLNDLEWYWNDNFLYLRSDQGNPDIAGFKIEASVRSYCIGINNKKYITIENFKVNKAGDTSGGGPYGGFGAGIYVQNNSTNVTLSRCKATQNLHAGIFIENSSSVIIDSCIAHSNNVVGIQFWNNANSCTTMNCEMYNNGEEGLNFEYNVKNSLVENCVSHHNGKAGFDQDHGTENITYYRCKSYANGQKFMVAGNGFSIYNSNLASVANNIKYIYCIAYGNSNSGIELSKNSLGEDGVKIINSVFINNSGYNLCISDDNVTVINSIFMDAGYNREIYIDSIVKYYFLNNNVYFDSDGSTKLTLGDYVFNITDWQSLTGQDNYSMDLNPLFVDAPFRDFRLQPTSPCIDAGQDIDISEDFTGNTVPQGQRVDIGVLEYVSTSPPQNLRVISLQED